MRSVIIVMFITCYSCKHIKREETDRACGVSREEGKCLQEFGLASPKKSDCLRNVAIDGRILLKIDIKE
jgi:hypothetical protein